MIQKHLNFIPKELRPRQELPHEIIPMVFIFLFFGYVAVGQFKVSVLAHFKEKELAQLETTNVELSNKLKSITDQSKIDDHNSENFSAIQKVLNRKNYWSDIFKEMSVLIPEDVWLTNFSNRKGELKSSVTALDNKNDSKSSVKDKEKPKVIVTQQADQLLVVKGEATSQIAVAKFLAILEQSQYFKGARMVYSEKEKDIKPSRYRFEFSIPVRANTGGRG